MPSARTETELAREYTLLRGPKGKQLLKEVDAYTAGLNAYLMASKAGYPLWTRNDTVVAAAVLGGQYGVGGGDETRRAELLAELKVSLGTTEGRRVWNDLREQQDPETPVTAARTFGYGQNTSEAGNVIPDVGSVGLSVERASVALLLPHHVPRPATQSTSPARRSATSTRPSSSRSTCTAAASTRAASPSRACPGS